MTQHNVEDFLNDAEHEAFRKGKCELCEKPWRLLAKNIVHHSNGNRLDGRKTNLMTLCLSCHVNLHLQRVMTECVSNEYGIVTLREYEELRYSECEECKYIPDNNNDKNLVHHLNRNRHDNRKDNITTLCKRCHTTLHSIIMSGGYVTKSMRTMLDKANYIEVMVDA